MTRRATLLLATIAFVTACQAQAEVAVGTRRAPRASTAPRATEPATPAPRPSSPPTASPLLASPAVQATPAPPARLEKPQTPVHVLRGAIHIDAAYAVQAAGGLIAAGGGGIISNNGGTVIALSDIGVLANNGGNLIANNGGALTANGGVGIVANNGGAAIAVDVAGYALAQALTPATAAAKLGEVMPAAGILVRASSLRDGTPISLGVDGRGAPVYAVRTDLAGGYEVYVPEAHAGNVLITAQVPQASDPRLRYDMLVPVAGPDARAVDEDSTLVTRFLRRVYVNALIDIFATPDIDAMVQVFESYDNVPASLRGLMVLVARDFRAAGDEVGLSRGSRAEIEAVAVRMADIFTSRVDFDAVTVGTEALPVGGQRRAEVEKVLDAAAIPLTIRVMKAVRERSAELLAGDPQFFDRQKWYTEPNAARIAAGRPAIEVKRPSDVGLFFVDTYMTSTNGDVYDQLDAAAATMGLTIEPGSGVPLGSVLFGVGNATALAVGAVMFGDPEAKAQALEAIAAWRPGAAAPQETR